MSDNEIKRLGNFAPAPRLGTLLLNNNAVAKIDGDLLVFSRRRAAPGVRPLPQVTVEGAPQVTVGGHR